MPAGPSTPTSGANQVVKTPKTNTGNAKNRSRKKPPRTSIVDKHIIFETCQRVAVSSALSAVARGMPWEQATDFGVTRAGEYRKSYAESIKIVTDSQNHIRPSVPVRSAVTHYAKSQGECCSNLPEFFGSE